MLAAATALTVVAVVIGENPAQQPVSATSTTVGAIPCLDGLPAVSHGNWSTCQRVPVEPRPEPPVVQFEAQLIEPQP